MIYILFAVENLHDLLNVFVGKHIVIGLFSEQAAGINELGGVVGFMFGEHQYINGDAGAEKQVGREGRSRFQQSCYALNTDEFSARRRRGKNTGEADNGSATSAGKVAEGMGTKAKSALDLGARTPAGAKRSSLISVGSSEPIHFTE